MLRSNDNGRQGAALLHYPIWIGYAYAVVLIAGLDVLLIFIRPYFPLDKYPILYILVVMSVGYIFGELPMIISLILGFASYTDLFSPPVSIASWAGVAAFLIGSLVGGYAASTVRSSRIRLQLLASDLQKALAPPAPVSREGYSVAAKYVPVAPGTEIGGDFYDVFNTSDGKVAVFIGDVAGKGIKAASLSAITRSTVRAFAYNTSCTCEVLNRANAVLIDQQPEFGSFVTVALLIIDPATGEFQYSAAGHPPTAICRVNGEVEFLPAGQPPIGLLPEYTFVETMHTLHAGEKLVLYTDGISEARRDSIMFEIEGIESVLKSGMHLTTRDLADTLFTAAKEWAEGIMKDDAAILVVERMAGSVKEL